MNFLYVDEYGDALVVHHQNDTVLETLQTLVEGNIEYVPTDTTILGVSADVWINEDGLSHATFESNLLGSLFAGMPLVGPAVVCRSSDEGETVGLTDDDLESLVSNGLALDDNEGQGYTPQEAVAMRVRTRAWLSGESDSL
jgi:hypothetical protein